MIVSTPVPPRMSSPPGSSMNVSSPPRPLSVSSPGPPFMWSGPGPPCSRSSPLSPSHAAGSAVRFLIASFLLPPHIRAPSTPPGHSASPLACSMQPPPSTTSPLASLIRIFAPSLETTTFIGASVKIDGRSRTNR